MKKVIDRGKEARNPMQKEVLSSHKLQDHAYEWQNPFGSKEDNTSQRNSQNQLSHSSSFHIDQEYHESLIHIQQNSSNLKYWQG